ncbi:MAG: DUF429 domain-containing protein [Brevundimonas sp.]|nr:MAG: DUF429 domain-containing protein [Brevundimonas sp.]
MLVAGIDGTKKGWVVVTLDDRKVDVFGVRVITQALEKLESAAAIAIDMPIGFLSAAEPGGRGCEKAARAILGGGRASSVFSSPCRSALSAPDYVSASQANRDSSPYGLGLSKQAHAIFPKMREIDLAMTPATQDRVFEVHPEVCFTELARTLDQRINENKKSWGGANQRVDLLEAAGIPLRPLLSQARVWGAATDDVVDAAVGAWTARRRVLGLASCIPAAPQTDAMGLRMEMWV